MKIRLASTFSPWFARAMALGLCLTLVILGWLAYPAVEDSRHGLLVVALLAGAVFALGLMLAVRVVRANADLAERRAEFVSSVTHELKTPIATVRAAGETLLSGRLTGPDASREYAQLVVDQAKRLTRLMDNLLAYARITDVTEGYAFQPLAVDSLVQGTLKDFRSQLGSAGFDVAVDIPPDLPAVRADRTAIGLMLDNLVDNAVRHSHETRSITIRARQADHVVILEVADRGTGIPTDELGKVTRKFYRGRLAASGGSGLGLAIVARIVADHSGSLTLQSAVDIGTTASVTLPIWPASHEASHPRR